MVQEVFGRRTVPFGAKADETRQNGNMLVVILKLGDGTVPDRNARGWKVEGEKRKATKKERKSLREKFQVRVF